MSQNRIFNTIVNLVSLPKVSIDRIDNKNVFVIKNENQFVPNFEFVWDSNYNYYRVKILVAGTTHDKRLAGYAICNVDGGMAAMEFATMYAFLHKRRANNREQKFVS